MCIVNATSIDPPEERVGWKVFHYPSRGVIRGLYYTEPSHQTTGYPMNTWIRSYVGPGFHAFEYKRDAQKWTSDLFTEVVQVKLRGVYQQGFQEYTKIPIFVGHEMMILEDKPGGSK